ncbi:hypothetical protein ACTWP5_04775 [Streptomyces sp. 4N509B]|uniref:hypothetical protein n=1 Tax=Streptomyces sp. 4N509B TaxID=3457413 RepID=UPI003FD25DEC
MIGLVLRLYPRRYRLECGEEILAVYQQATADASPADRWREAADIAAHGVRTRLGVSSVTAAGRFLASAAPFAVGAAAADSGTHLSRWYAVEVSTPGPAHFFADAWSVLLLASALVVVGAVTALTGRWRVGVVAVAVGLVALAVAAVVSGPAFGDPLVTPAMALLTTLVVLACPPDLLPGPGVCVAAGAMAAAAWLPVAALQADALPVSTDYGMWPLLVLAATGLVLAWRSTSPGLTETAAMAAACPPFVAYAYRGGWGELLTVVGIATAVPLAGVLAVGVHALRLRGGSNQR